MSGLRERVKGGEGRTSRLLMYIKNLLHITRTLVLLPWFVVRRATANANASAVEVLLGTDHRPRMNRSWVLYKELETYLPGYPLL